MTQATDTSLSPPVNHGWRVTFAGMGINLALGVLYSWSVISGAMTAAAKAGHAEWDWTQTEKNLPYSIACLVFCLIMVPAGRMQDRIGPRIVATIGGILVGAGMILASFIATPLGFIIGFGVLAGAGFGFGYASATPPAVKWFPKAKTGLIAGLVVSGFGLASVYIAPLADALIKSPWGIQGTMLALGIGFLIVVVSLAQLLKSPPKGYVPQDLAKVDIPAAAAAAPNKTQKKEDFTPTEMLKTWQFYLLWGMYACGAGAGLMVISVAKTLGAAGAGTIAVMGLAIGNGGGRILAGVVSDKLGRKLTLALFFIFQAVMVILLSLAQPGSALSSSVVLTLMAAFVGANYGANLSLFPSVTKDYYGLKNFGVNYGLVFTAWGVGGFMLSLLAGYIKDITQTFTFAYYCSAVLLVLAAAATFLVKAPHHVEAVPEPVTEPEAVEA